MAVLSDQGKHCAVDLCRQNDFLPFTCDQCHEVFCINHFRYGDHSCPHAAGLDNRVLLCPLCQKAIRLVAGEDPNATWERHVRAECGGAGAVAKKPRCPVSGCKEMLTFSGSVQCTKCYQKVCMKHRFEDAHDCVV